MEAPVLIHLFIELFTAGCVLVCVGHAIARRGREGVWLFAALFGVGLLRENFVALYRLLYEFAPLTRLGAAPLIASIIWGYSIYLAMVWAEGPGGFDPDRSTLEPRFLIRVALFMVALACFYEPLLLLLGMARWEEGTRATLGVPWIALLGYPSLTVGFLVVWEWATRCSSGASRVRRLALGLVPLALGHAAGLQGLKSWLGW